MLKDKKIKKQTVPLDLFFWEMILFSLTLFLGIATAFKINKSLKVQEISVAPINFIHFFSYFIIGTLFVLFITIFIKSKPKKGTILKSLFVFTIFWGGLMTLDIWLAGALLWVGDILALFLMFFFLFIWLKNSSILIHNICIILGISGVGAFLGLRMEPRTVLFLFLIFSIYDFIAVYKTKHMVKIAKEMIEHQAVIAMIIPQKAKDFQGKLKEIKTGGKFMILGGGDIVFPLLLAVSLIPRGFFSALIIGVFSLLGLFLSFLIFISQKEKKAIPALPPIALFSILGYLINLIS